MDDTAIRDIVIIGGGTAGWMAAAALVQVLPSQARITLVESEDIGTVGVGEATIPTIQAFNQTLGLDEREFVRRTKATFKLGIDFVDWGGLGQRYTHGFGRIGQGRGVLPFYQYWLKLFAEGTAPDLADCSINTVAPRASKFMPTRTDLANSPLADLVYAYHFDAHLYAALLREHAQGRGVRRIQGTIVETKLHETTGFIEAVRVDGAESWIGGQLFIDCSGFRGLLIEDALHTGYEDWSRWLPCDRAIAVPTESSGLLAPVTRSTAHEAGWQWRIPLQHRTGNGHVFASAFTSEDAAHETLIRHLDGRMLAEPRTLRFTTGKRRKIWNRNCVAVGLASGFLEPLESTGIHLIQSVIARLVALFPRAGFDPTLIDEFNRQADAEYECVRDFIVLHYHATAREDTAFWRHCREMDIPTSLKRRIRTFESTGRIVRDPMDLFSEESWLQVMHGQGIRARTYHPMADAMSSDAVAAFVQRITSVIAHCATLMPTHEEFLASLLSQHRAKEPVLEH